MKPVIGRSFGKIKTSITKAISNFEQRKTSPGKKNQIAALGNLNSTIYLLLDALNEMQNSEKHPAMNNLWNQCNLFLINNKT